jgi:hypothetical protein
MNMIRHHDKRVEMVFPLIPVAIGIHYHLGDQGQAQEEGACARAV